MQNKKRSSVGVKSNIALKSTGGAPPVDLQPPEALDRRLERFMSEKQINQKEKMEFWASRVCNESGQPVIDQCYKGCENCATANNCRRPRKL